MVGSNPIGNMVIKLSLDDADFGKGVANSKKQIQYLSKEMQANTKIADLADNTIGKLGAQHTGLSKIIEAQEKQVNALKVAYDESFVDGKPTESTKRLATQLQDANGKLANYKLQLNATEKAMMMYSQEADNAEKNIAFLSKEMDLNAQMASLSGKNSQVMAANYDGLSKIIVEQANHVNALAQAYDNSFVDGKPTEATKELSLKLKESQIELAKTAGAVAELEVKTQGLTGGIYRASESMISAGDKMASVGGKMTKSLTVPIAGAVAAVTAAAMSWETDFASVMKTNDEVVDSNGKVVYSYDELEAGLRGLTSTYHSSHSKIAGVAEAAGQLGIETQNVVDFTETMIMLGETTVFSAEDASFALARLANITGMPQTEFRNLGSSLVELGNNFAATEAEIGNMAMNLAAAGTQVGMTEGEILGFAAALSSVGIEAQAGGTAFSKVMIEMQLATETGIGAFDELKAHAEDQGVSWEQLTLAVRNGGKELTDVSGKMGFTSAELRKMYKEADNSKTSLEEFADVAGMTSEQFANLFKENPAEAIMEFVVGLSKAEEQGSSTIKVLDDMGISEVRLRDALLRGANASDLFSDSIRMGNQAYSEGTALSDEYAVRQETTAHKLGVLKNQAKDVAITLGGPFLDALNSGIEGAKPLIEKIGELAQAFADADPKTQQTIVTLLGVTAVAGPLLAITGKLTSGIGGLGKSFVDLMANMKKKSAIDAATAAFEAGDLSASDFMVTLLTGKTTVSQFGGAASTAAGAKGVGAMTGALGTLSPVLLGIVGVGGALAIGYGAWKLFGEEAWNSSQRVKTWGTEVDETTAKTLGLIQDNTQEATGQFSLLEQGIETDTGKMIDNFERIGATIESELTGRIEAFREAVDMLPDEIKGPAEEIIAESEKRAEQALAIVEDNNRQILDIRKKYVDEEGEVTIQGAKMIQDLMRQSTQEYLNITIEDADARKEVMNALNGDIETATQEQAQAWMQSLGKQRQATKESYSQQLNDFKSYLDDKGILHTQEGQQLVELFEQARDDSTKAIDTQIDIITQKYPELLEIIYAGNGQFISEMGEAGAHAIAENEKIVANAQRMSSKLAENARKNAEAVAWTADQATKAGAIWNSLELIDKEGNVKSNANEIVIEATKDVQTWNDMKLLIHDANLDSNAKRIIGEAAIVNKRWDGMAFGDKKAILQDEFSITIYEALRSSGKWQEMEIEEKTAFLYSNSEETMRETLISLDLWDDLKWEEKAALLDTNAPDSVREAMISSGLWDNLTWEEQRAILETNVTEVTIRALEENGKWQEMSWEEKLMVVNSNTPEKVASALFDLGLWQEFLPEIKELGAQNFDLLDTISTSEVAINEYNRLDPDVKKLLGEDPVSLTVSQAQKILEVYNGVGPDLKRLLGENTVANRVIEDSHRKLDSYNRENVAPKHLHATANYSEVVRAREEIAQVVSKNVVIDVEYRGRRTGQQAIPAATGLNYHKGGPLLVNDQIGPLYKELVEYPDGTSFIPEGRNVMLDAPIGTKVHRASITQALVPQNIEEFGVPEDSSMVRNLRFIGSHSATNATYANTDTSAMESKLDRMILLLEKISRRPIQNGSSGSASGVVSAIDDVVGKEISKLLGNRGLGHVL